MTLRRKTILIIGLTLIGLLAVLGFCTKTFMLQRFLALEAVDARQAMLRTQNALDNELLVLDTFVGDWATWTDTYLFVQNLNPEYIEDNLSPATLTNLDINLIAYINTSGQVIAGWSSDPWTGYWGAIPAEFAPHIAPGTPLATHTHAASSVTGFVMVAGKIMLVASRPILPSTGEGPIQGVLVMGRYLDDRALLHISSKTLLASTLISLDAAHSDPFYRDALSKFSPSDPFYARPVDDANIVSLGMIYDLYGEPAAILRVNQVRSVYRQGQELYAYFAMALVIFAAIYALVSIFLLEKQVLSRLARLAREVLQIGRSGEAAWKVTVEGTDEVASLAQTINDMLGALDQSKEALRDAHDELEQRVDERTVELASANRELQLEVSERRRAEAALALSEDRYALATRGSNDGIWDIDLQTNQVYYSSRWKAMLGYSDTEIGDSLDEWYNRVHTDDLHRLQSDMHLHLTGFIPQFESEHRLLDKGGSYHWVRARGLAVWDEALEATRIAGSLTDVSGQKQIEEQLQHDSMYDLLTKLSNRTYFLAQLKRTVEHVRRRSDFLAAVLIMDLDRFKVVNDSLGHHVGDQLLLLIARRLETCLRPGDTVSRLGGDEFGILLEDIHQVSDAIRVASRIQEALCKSFIIEDQEVFTSASIGIALTNAGYINPEDILRDADTAMYRAKANGKARHEIFDKGMHATSIGQLQLEADLRRAIERKELQVFYQPLVSLADGRITRVEALVRWQHPQRGWIPPRDFIPVAEETGLIVPLGAWVLETACRQTKAWHAAGFTSLGVSVNIAAAQLQDPQFDRLVAQVLSRTELPAEALELEITESTAMHDVECSFKILRALRALGVGISIDDFGISYSSLGYLKRFPVTTLKIDRSFISDLQADNDSAAIVKAILAMSHVLKLCVVAEGVEETGQMDWLVEQLCDEAQGYLFSPAIPADDLTALIRQISGTFSQLA